MTTPVVPVITRHDIDGLADAMAIMQCAFDPQFGEAWTAAQCTGVLAMPGTHLLIARAPTPVGFALLRTVVDEAELMLLAVTPAMRGQGIGRALLQQSFDQALEAGAQSYFLEVRGDNPAIQLYVTMGLVRVGVRRDYYKGHDGTRRDALTYRLMLR